MLKFISFNSGSCGNCYFLFTENDGLMIDVGISMRRLKQHFREYGLKLSQIKHVIVTHDHADHVKSVGNLSRDCDVNVYATRAVHGGIVQNRCVHRKIDWQYVKYINKGETFTLGEFEITSFDVPHDSAENVGYQIKCQGQIFSVITDIGHVTDDIRRAVNHANYLVLESNHDVDKLLHESGYPRFLIERIIDHNRGHLSNVECGKVLAENASMALKHVWLCHLSGNSNDTETARRTVEQILREHDIQPGEDFKLDVLERNVVSGFFDLLP